MLLLGVEEKIDEWDTVLLHDIQYAIYGISRLDELLQAHQLLNVSVESLGGIVPDVPISNDPKEYCLTIKPRSSILAVMNTLKIS
jgi:hypothetical protein